MVSHVGDMASLKMQKSGVVDALEGLEFGDVEVEDGLEAVAVFDDFSQANDSALVILAMGAAYWMIQHEQSYVLCVAEARAGAVRRELRAVAALESARGRYGRFEYEEFDFGWISFLLYGVVLVACFIWQGRAPIVSLGQADALAMIDGGEWWRAVTALTLHADIVHLVSNLVAGLGFAFFVCRFFGAPAGWFLVLLSGAAGNALNAAVYYPEAHYSIGASTAVFGALGLLTGVGLWAAVSAPERMMILPRWLIPSFGGLTLLGLFGLGEGNVDVAAHISGFLCGVVFGFFGAVGQRLFIGLQRWRFGGAGLSLLALGLAWWWAWTDIV